MKNILILTIVVASLSNSFLFAQEKYPLRQLTLRPDQVGFFDWSPDAKTIVYSKSTGLWKFSVEGGDPWQIIIIQTQHPDWSPDGKYIVFDADKGDNHKNYLLRWRSADSDYSGDYSNN
jgi:Tol biopolymer transport system component